MLIFFCFTIFDRIGWQGLNIDSGNLDCRNVNARTSIRMNVVSWNVDGGILTALVSTCTKFWSWFSTLDKFHCGDTSFNRHEQERNAVTGRWSGYVKKATSYKLPLSFLRLSYYIHLAYGKRFQLSRESNPGPFDLSLMSRLPQPLDQGANII